MDVVGIYWNVQAFIGWLWAQTISYAPILTRCLISEGLVERHSSRILFISELSRSSPVLQLNYLSVLMSSIIVTYFTSFFYLSLLINLFCRLLQFNNVRSRQVWGGLVTSQWMSTCDIAHVSNYCLSSIISKVWQHNCRRRQHLRL